MVFQVTSHQLNLGYLQGGVDSKLHVEDSSEWSPGTQHNLLAISMSLRNLSFPCGALWNILCFWKPLCSEQPQEGPGS